MTTLKSILDRVTTGWYFALLCLLTVAYFGSGVYAHHSDVKAEREASVRAQIEKCKVGQFCRFEGHGFLKVSGGKR